MAAAQSNKPLLTSIRMDKIKHTPRTGHESNPDVKHSTKIETRKRRTILIKDTTDKVPYDAKKDYDDLVDG